MEYAPEIPSLSPFLTESAGLGKLSAAKLC